MKDAIHPNYVESTVSCACGSSFQTRSTQKLIKLDICAKCHPFFTGQQKLLDTAGRVERFEKRFAKTAGETLQKSAPTPKAAKGQKLATATSNKKFKVLTSTPMKAKPTTGGGKPVGKTEKGAKPADKPEAKAH